MEEGVVGVVLLAVEFCWEIYRSGDAGRRVRGKFVGWGKPRMGELLRSAALGVCSSEESPPVSLISLKPRAGRPGKTSSTGFLGVRTRLGDPRGLAGRCCGDISRCPAALNPGID